MVVIQFDMRRSPNCPDSQRDRYRACLEMVRWADHNGVDVVGFSEHHNTEDGFLSSPLMMAMAAAQVSENIGISVSALLLALHDPVRVVRRNAQSGLGLARGQGPAKGLVVVHVVDYLKPAGVAKRLGQLASISPAVLVEDNHRDVFDLGVEGIAEDDCLHHRHDKHEEQRRRLAANVSKLLG